MDEHAWNIGVTVLTLLTGGGAYKCWQLGFKWWDRKAVAKARADQQSRDDDRKDREQEAVHRRADSDRKNLALEVVVKELRISLAEERKSHAEEKANDRKILLEEREEKALQRVRIEEMQEMIDGLQGKYQDTLFELAKRKGG